MLVVDPPADTQVCTTQPVHVNRNCSFVVNSDSLESIQDLKADDNGSWVRKGAPVVYFSVHLDKFNKKKVFKRSKMGDKGNHYKLVRTYYWHASSKDFKRIISVVKGD